MSFEATKPQNYLRIPVACLACRGRKVKCERGNENETCKRCLKYSLKCEVKSVTQQRESPDANGQMVFHHWNPAENPSSRSTRPSTSSSSQQLHQSQSQSHPHRSSTPRLPGSAVSQNPAYMTNQHHRSSSIPYTGSNTSQFAGMTQQTSFQTYNQAYGGNEAAIPPQSYNNYQQAGQQGNFWDPYQMQTIQQQQQQQFGASYPSTAQPVYQQQYPAQYNTGMCYCQGPQCFCGNRQQY